MEAAPNPNPNPDPDPNPNPNANPNPNPDPNPNHAKDEISMWTVAVPKQREISPLTPYDKAMSVQELLEELVCVRLDQDFQPHKLSLTLTPTLA